MLRCFLKFRETEIKNRKTSGGGANTIGRTVDLDSPFLVRSRDDIYFVKTLAQPYLKLRT